MAVSQVSQAVSIAEQTQFAYRGAIIQFVWGSQTPKIHILKKTNKLVFESLPGTKGKRSAPARIASSASVTPLATVKAFRRPEGGSRDRGWRQLRLGLQRSRKHLNNLGIFLLEKLKRNIKIRLSKVLKTLRAPVSNAVAALI